MNFRFQNITYILKLCLGFISYDRFCVSD